MDEASKFLGPIEGPRRHVELPRASFRRLRG
jgi:hypothetical protein